MTTQPPRFAPFAGPAPRPPIILEGAADPPAEDDFPPIEQFLDEYPSIDDYLAEEEAEAVSPEVAVATVDPEPPLSSAEPDEWAAAEWQSYDWNGLASLAPREEEQSRPEAEWGDENEWPEPAPETFTTQSIGEGLSVTATEGSGAEEVARAFDDMARRIRSGELTIDQLRTSSPEAAMAAALAAMLRLRE